MFDKEWFRSHEISLSSDEVDGRVFRKKPKECELDLLKPRPLKFLNYFELENFVKFALDCNYPAIELATLGLDEAKIRYKNSDLRRYKFYQSLFTDKKIVPIGWLSEAREKVKKYKVNNIKKIGKGVVYFVLVDGFTPVNGKYGCYVGMSKTNDLSEFDDRQSARIAQHFRGIKIRRKYVKDRGIEPLWSLNCFSNDLPYKRPELLVYETGFNLALQEVVPKVLGDTLKV